MNEHKNNGWFTYNAGNSQSNSKYEELDEFRCEEDSEVTNSYVAWGNNADGAGRIVVKNNLSNLVSDSSDTDIWFCGFTGEMGRRLQNLPMGHFFDMIAEKADDDAKKDPVHQTVLGLQTKFAQAIQMRNKTSDATCYVYKDGQGHTQITTSLGEVFANYSMKYNTDLMTLYKSYVDFQTKSAHKTGTPLSEVEIIIGDKVLCCPQLVEINYAITTTRIINR